MNRRGHGDKAVRQPIIRHIQELRRRLFWSVVCLCAGAGIGYFLNEKIFNILIKPLNQPLFYTSPTGGFDFLLKICIFFGVIVSVPVFTYNILKFLEPTLPSHNRWLLVKFLASSCVLAVFGVGFAYFISLPAALHFLNSFGSDQVKSLISTNEYFSFVMVYLAGFAVLFQLPIIILFINRIKPLKPGGLMKQQRFVIVISFVAAAVITPTPDPLNQTIMAGPIIALYQISILLVWLVNRKSQKRLRITESKIEQKAWSDIPASLNNKQTWQEPVASASRTSNYTLVDLRGLQAELYSFPKVPTTNVIDLRRTT